MLYLTDNAFLSGIVYYYYFIFREGGNIFLFINHKGFTESQPTLDKKEKEDSSYFIWCNDDDNKRKK